MATTPDSIRAVRLDIQALRAVAVAMVVVFHLVPRALPGGYVGVDVFFVISGFLITTLLIERPPTSRTHLVDFWARRIRRLLPASLLVLAVSVAGAWALLPASQWDATVQHARAATLYVVNWTLLADSVDYLAADRAPTVVQHFWSLAVEEQFYLGWPLLILALTRLGSAARRRRTYIVGLGAVVALSLAYSIALTATNPSAAYFSAFTRVWELGVGGLVAIAAPRLARLAAGRSGAAATVLASVGWGAVAASGVLLSESTPFPGWAAVLPVGGTALVIAGHTNFGWYALRPVHWLGDVSYSVYLWHWPLILLLPAAAAKITGTPDRGTLDNVLIVVATLVLAGVSKPLVEDRFRTPRWAPRRRATYALGATGMAAVLILCAGFGSWSAKQREIDRRELAAALATDHPCFGAAARDRSHQCSPTRGSLVPAPASAAKDMSAAYEVQPNGKNCLAQAARFQVITCQFGEPKATTEVALIGNSHAAQWLPALERIAAARHWRITTYLAARCVPADVLLNLTTLDQATACRAWGHEVVRRVGAQEADLVVMTNAPTAPWRGIGQREATASYVAGYRRTLARFAASKTPVLIIRDTPVPAQGNVIGPDCLASATNWDDCSGPRDVWLTPDPAIAAATSEPGRGITVADFSEMFCGATVCYTAIGGVTVYFDGGHMTATFAKTLAPYLDRAVMEAMSARAAD